MRESKTNFTGMRIQVLEKDVVVDSYNVEHSEVETARLELRNAIIFMDMERTARLTNATKIQSKIVGSLTLYPQDIKKRHDKRRGDNEKENNVENCTENKSS